MDPQQGKATAGPRPLLERVPGWQQYPWLRAGFSTRIGGFSQVYGADEQNLGWTDEDDAGSVAANRAAFVEALAPGASLQMVTVRQVHGSRIRDLDREPAPLMTQEGKAVLEGDGMITAEPNRLLAILTADCVPVLLADTRTHALGAFHAGWRGTLAHIAADGVAALQQGFGADPGNMIAAIGPCIRACCFAVGPEVRSAFERSFPKEGDLFEVGAQQQVCMDLAEANRRQLIGAGLGPESIQVLAQCTACARTAGGGRKYFSYRAEQGRTGRMLSAIAALT